MFQMFKKIKMMWKWGEIIKCHWWNLEKQSAIPEVKILNKVDIKSTRRKEWTWIYKLRVFRMKCRLERLKLPPLPMSCWSPPDRYHWAVGRELVTWDTVDLGPRRRKQNIRNDFMSTENHKWCYERILWTQSERHVKGTAHNSRTLVMPRKSWLRQVGTLQKCFLLPSML